MKIPHKKMHIALRIITQIADKGNLYGVIIKKLVFPEKKIKIIDNI
jgi:hypothetical protein